MPTHELALDCGSGGTRIWRRTTRGGAIERVAWPAGGKAPVLSAILSSTDGREAFAAALRGLPSPPFIGATAGMRHAMSTGVVTEDHVDALRALLPAGAVLAVLSPLDEARHELRALRQCYPDQSAAMISLGGKSMQLGREGSLASLPFAMHLGSDMLEEPGVCLYLYVYTSPARPSRRPPCAGARLPAAGEAALPAPVRAHPRQVIDLY